MALQFDCRNRNIARKALPLLLGVFIVAFLYKRNSLHHFNSLKVLAGTTQQAYSSQPGAKISETLSHHETEHRESIPPLRPVNVFQQYIQQHSQQVLLSEIQEAALTENRKYAVAYYWCPQRAGNILHSFFNTVVWSMIHNRTILWMYHNTSNQEQDCQAVLQRAQWLPSLLEWGPKLNLQDPVPVANSADTWYVDQKHQVVLYPQIPDVLSFDKTITRTAWSDHPLKTREFRAYIEQLPSDLQNISHNLYSEGQEFLFGMLYSELFQLQRPTASTIIGVGSGHNGIFSLALHSRHVVGADDGSFVAQEKECLDQLLKGHDDSCRIHIMSDRPRTIALLSDWLLVVKNCTVITATHDTGSGPVQEHGPWAGAGYLEDLDITAGARHGVIGDPHRSSTALLIDLMEYRRTVSAWKDDDKRIPQALKICKLPDKPISGYDYGPGSPTFRHHSYLEPLAPVRVLDKFMTGSRNESATILLSIDFDRPTVKEVYTVLNSFLYAIANNLNVRWNPFPENPMCGEGSSLAPKITWNGDNESDEDFRKNVSAIEVTLEDNPITFADGRENLDAIVLFMPNATMRYGVSEWHALLDDERKPDVRRLLEDMFAQGQDVAYGILFHELFSYCPAVSIDDGNFAAYSYVLHLESRASLSVETIQRCMVSVLHANEEENSIVAGVLEHDKSCHFYIMADIPTIQNSVLASMIHQSETESPRLIVGQDQGSCSFSFLYMGIVDESDHDENEALPPTFWKHVEEASAARAGWIGPENPKKFGRLGVGAGLVRERFEYKRHHETWKQGREPFWIPKITECFY